jgi:hypothetical protein
MPVIATINFQIMGAGNVELGGAAATAGTLSGPYWNTIQIVDPSSATVEFSTGVTQPAGWNFITWGGQIVPGVLGFGTLSIATDVSASYLAVAVFAEGPQATPTLCFSQSCGTGLVTGAPPEPSHESIRIANKVRACEQIATAAAAAAQPPTSTAETTVTRTVCGPALTPLLQWIRQPTDQEQQSGLLFQTATAADPSTDNQFVVNYWRNVFDGSGGFLVYSLDVSGAFRWRTDLPIGVDTSYTYFDSSSPCVVTLFDTATGTLFIAATVMTWSIPDDIGRLYVYLFKLNPTTGAVLGSRIYDEGTIGAPFVPPLGFTTDRSGTLYYATTLSTVLLRGLVTDGTFDLVATWGGLLNTAAAPLVANCFGLTYDSEGDGYLYMNLTSQQTIQGGTRILGPPGPPENTIVVKLALAPTISVAWAYQSPALNTAGRSSFNSLVALADHSIRVLYENADPATGITTIGFAHLSATGTLVTRHDLPEYIPSASFQSSVLCRTLTTDRLFFIVSQVEVPYPVSFGELTHAGEVIWFVQSANFNPAGQTNALQGLTATDRFLWLAYLTRAAFPDQTQINEEDSVAIQFALRECFTITEKICQCPAYRPAQDFRTVHHRRESERILREAVRCPLYFQNRDTGALCPREHVAVHSQVQSPYSLTAQRVFHRIRGIEEICRPVRAVTGTELTARARARAENSSVTLRRHSEHFRTLPPPRPCRLYQTGPQPGVPIAPVTPCNLGNQRVDYSPSTK